ncbi:MAG: transglutaminase-like domain-containing protein [Bacteroidia bacterium]|nr:transglutaminase-like domain-containing protein [Bacteroidia bacterium]
MKAFISRLKYKMKRHPFLHKARWFMVTKSPKPLFFRNENYNAYNSKDDIHPIFFEDNPITESEQHLSTLVKVIKIAEHFNTFFKRGRGLGLSSRDSYVTMRYKKGGVCSDYAQVFINFCIINDIKIREWGIKGGTQSVIGGHSFNEFWSEELKKWILIDVYNGMFIINKSSRELLSVSQLVDYMSGFNADNLDFEILVDRKEPLNKLKLSKYFFDNRNLFFLITNYRIKKVDAFLKYQNIVPLALLHTSLIFFKRYFNYRFYVNENNINYVRETLKPILKYNYAPDFNAGELAGAVAEDAFAEA